ncbi:asparaginase [Lapillicoccus jejuensis]|uniref:Asparaginase n=1 Tax=Lapillicoccus jejuensis TaxID=402171 RepID=A0A542E3Q8_9MICO|nr:asparaginase [Lapillicoccus jejuensis]
MRLIELPPPTTTWSLLLHGGAGGRVEELAVAGDGPYADGLRAAWRAGAAVLSAGGSALDAVGASVEVLEDDPLFNAGRGAALTAAGTAELDACVMSGDGRAGAVAASRHARHPVAAARRVRDEGRAVLLVDPPVGAVERWGLERVDGSWFVTPARQQQLARVTRRELEPARHGTVGAVAVDASGHVAAATSTGGMVGQSEGRVGDSPIVGAGTYARDGVVAVSCTGEGEAFLQGLVAADIAARVRYLGADLATAVRDTVAAELAPRGASGGLVAVRPDGSGVVAHSSPAMYAAYADGGRLVTLT